MNDVETARQLVRTLGRAVTAGEQYIRNLESKKAPKSEIRDARRLVNDAKSRKRSAEALLRRLGG